MNFPELKRLLHTRCTDLIQQKIDSLRQAMDDAQASANQEEKNSAGDKYETGRAMAQIARDQAAQQLDEALLLKNVLARVATIPSTDKVSLGSLVITDKNRFYVSVSIGKLEIQTEQYLVISSQSPIGKLLMNRSVNDQIVFNHQKQTILTIC